MKNSKHDNRCMEKLPKGEQPSEDAIRGTVVKDKTRFLAAQQRAMQVIEEETDAPVSGFSLARAALSLSFAGIAALVCLMIFSINTNNIAVPNLIATPAVAGYLRGIEGAVISFHDHQPVSGVRVFEHIIDDSTHAKLVCVTDAFGQFEAPPVPEGESVELTFIYQDKQVGELVICDDLQDSKGYAKVLIDLHREQTSMTEHITLEPGSIKGVFPGVHLSLSTEAKETWSGTVVLDRNWPGYFANVQCLEGLIQVDGPESEYLKVGLSVGFDQLSLYQTTLSPLKVITHSQDYRRQQYNENDWWRAAAHDGWYDIADEYLLGLDQTELRMQLQVPQITETELGKTVSWNPQTGNKYALVAPVQIDGRAIACWYSYYNSSTHVTHPTIKLIDRTKRISSLFEYRYYPDDEKGYYTDPSMLDRNESLFSFDRSEMSRNHAPASEGIEPLLEKGTFAKLPGMFQIVRYDLSLSNPVEYPQIEADFSIPPGNYEVEVDKNDIGENTILRLTGEIDRLAKAPKWDFYGDYIWDSQGYLTLFRPTHTGEYVYKVILEEKCGNIIVLDRSLRFPASWAIGYQRNVRDKLVVKSHPAKPESQGSLCAYSEYAVSSPAAYGVSIGQIAGPVLCIDVPDDFRNVPLKEMTVHLFARGVAGDYKRMPLRIFADSVSKEKELDEFGLWQFENNVQFSELTALAGKTYLDPRRMSWEIKHIYRSIGESTPDEQVADLLRARALAQGNPRFNEFCMTKIGVDLDNLENESNLAEKLLAFRDSPYMCLKYVTDETSEWKSSIDLGNGQLHEEDYILLRIKMEDAAMPYAAQYDLYSGGDTLSRVEIEAVDGRRFTTYIDYAPIVE